MTGPVGPRPPQRPDRAAPQSSAPAAATTGAAAEPPPLGDRALDRLRGQLETPPVIGGRYELRGLLGRGGMGEVHLAFDRQLQREVAVKVLPADASATQLAARLEQESRVLAQLEHPGIVPVYDAGVLEDGRVYYVMRYFKGMRFDEYARSGVSRGELLRSLLRIAEAIGYAHEHGVIHRDLKPGNVMIGPHGDRLVLDWGVAKVLGSTSERQRRSTREDTEGAERGGGADAGGAVAAGGAAAAAAAAVAGGTAGAPSASARLTADGVVVGTPGYMAPEQAAGGPIDARADVYALGVMMREMLAVHPDPTGKALAAIIAMATATAPELRYASVGAFAEDLRRWLDGEAVTAHREGPTERLLRFMRRHQVAILLLLTYAVVRVMILLWRGV